MPYTTINKHKDFFNTVKYDGNSSSKNVTGVGFQPDFTWIKDRNSSGDDFGMYDVVRGVTKRIRSNQNDAENTESQGLTAFGTDGFTVGTSGSVNGNGDPFCSWNWKAGNSQGSSNTDGSINTTYTSVNTTSGFSISKYTGTGSNATVGHGLGVAPNMIWIKCLSEVQDWFVYHDSIGTNAMRLNGTGTSESGVWNSTAPTNQVFSIGTAQAVNKSSGTYVAFCFAEKLGFSKFGKFKAANDDDNTFVFTGFAPQLVILKPLVSDSWSHWYMFDTVRDGNMNILPLYANLSTREAYYGGSPQSNYAQIDILSSGFKIRRNSSWGAGGNQESIYMAWGQTLVGSNNIPCTAR